MRRASPDVAVRGGHIMRLSASRHPINVVDPDLVHIAELWPGRRLPMLVTPHFEGVDLAGWLAEHRAEVELIVLRFGGLLFRGFDVRTAADFTKVVNSFSTEPIEYTERSTPRSQVSSFVYTSTEYPADQVIPLHNENSYSHTWPEHLWFFCERSADSGGETSIADSREVFRLIDPAVRDRFIDRRITYVRNYAPSLGLSWQDTFQTDSKREVERYCQRAGIEWRWSGDRLTTRQTRHATAHHPVTGEVVWFNQAHLFHPSSLPRGVYRSLASAIPEESFPRHACYGDGAALEREALEHVRDVYRRAQERVRWRNRDVLLLDNMLAAHGRLPYRGSRRILVTMARPCTAA